MRVRWTLWIFWDAISDPQAELLDGEKIELELDERMTPGPVRLVVSQGCHGGTLGLTSDRRRRSCRHAARWQTGLRTVLATGMDVAAELIDTSTLTLRRALD